MEIGGSLTDYEVGCGAHKRFQLDVMPVMQPPSAIFWNAYTAMELARGAAVAESVSMTAVDKEQFYLGTSPAFLELRLAEPTDEQLVMAMLKMVEKCPERNDAFLAAARVPFMCNTTADPGKAARKILVAERVRAALAGGKPLQTDETIVVGDKNTTRFACALGLAHVPAPTLTELRTFFSSHFSSSVKRVFIWLDLPATLCTRGPGPGPMKILGTRARVGPGFWISTSTYPGPGPGLNDINPGPGPGFPFNAQGCLPDASVVADVFVTGFAEELKTAAAWDHVVFVILPPPYTELRLPSFQGFMECFNKASPKLKNVLCLDDAVRWDGYRFSRALGANELVLDGSSVYPEGTISGKGASAALKFLTNACAWLVIEKTPSVEVTDVGAVHRHDPATSSMPGVRGGYVAKKAKQNTARGAPSRGGGGGVKGRSLSG